MRMELYNKFMKLLHIGQYLNNFQKDITEVSQVNKYQLACL